MRLSRIIFLIGFCAVARGDSPASLKLANAALAQVGVTTTYDPSNVKLRYPGGDLPKSRGVCSDVVIRAFRTIGIDLQMAVHEDMQTLPRLSADVGVARAGHEHRSSPSPESDAIFRAPRLIKIDRRAIPAG